MKYLPKEVEKCFLISIRAGNKKALDYFVRKHQLLVTSIAEKFAFSADVLPDLIAEGNKGLLKAIEKFDEKFNVRFISYAYFWIKRFIIRAIMKEFEVLKIPERYQEFRERVEELKKNYMFENGRYPTDREIAETLNLPPEIVKKLKKYASVRGRSTNHHDEEPMYSENNKGQRFCDFSQDRNILEKIIERLRGEEKRANIDMWLKVIKLYYGLDGEAQHSYKEISIELNISRQRVHQIKKICLQKMKQAWQKLESDKKK